MNLKVVDCAFANPSRLPDILPLKSHDNRNWHAENSPSCFFEIATTFSGTLCDNLPAQVAGFCQVPVVENGRWISIIPLAHSLGHC
jgi:hypothetical protein